MNIKPDRMKVAGNRPCVIVLAVERGADGLIVTVVPVTHVSPANSSLAIELPPAVKRHLGLDGERSWVMLHEGNRFAWPGYDLRPVPRSTDRYDYGLLPPAAVFIDGGALQDHLGSPGQGLQVPRD